MKHLVLGMVGVASVLTWSWAEADVTCRAEFKIVTELDHGTLPAGTVLSGKMAYTEGRAMKMGPETVSYLSKGDVRITADDGSYVMATLRAIHLVRTPYFADYASFDAKGAVGNLGGVTSYEDPMLVSLFAERGTLSSFDLPRDTDGWTALSKRREFQVHTPDATHALPGKLSEFSVSCD